MDFRTLTALNAVCQRSMGRPLEQCAPRHFRYEELLPMAYAVLGIVGTARDVAISLEHDSDVCKAVVRHCATGRLDSLTQLADAPLALAREYVSTLFMLYQIGADRDPNGGILLPDLRDDDALRSSMLAREILQNRTPQRWLADNSRKDLH